jgi:hypothetical protein
MYVVVHMKTALVMAFRFATPMPVHSANHFRDEVALK